MTPVFAQCAEGRSDDPQWACAGGGEGGGDGEGGAGGEGGVIGTDMGTGGSGQDGGGDGGCSTTPGAPASGGALALLMLAGVLRRRRA